MNRPPRVVACLPAYNAAQFIERTLDALAAQTYPNLEILVSIDVSSDDTAAICEERSRRDPRFRIIRQARRLGWIGNVNALMQAARGEYLFFAFHDDAVFPEYVERLVDALERHPDAVSSYGDLELYDPDGWHQTLVYSVIEGIADPVERTTHVLCMVGYWWLPHRGLFRAAAVGGGLRRNWAGEFAADWTWQVHISLRGELVRVPVVLSRKHLRPDGVSGLWKMSKWTWLAAACACAGEVRRSSLSLRSKMRLYWVLVLVSRHLLRVPPVSKEETAALLKQHLKAPGAGLQDFEPPPFKGQEDL